MHADAVVNRQSPNDQTRANAELGYRWGLADDIDIGVRGHGMGGEINSRLRLASGYGFDLTASPFIGGGLIPSHQDNGGALRFPMGIRALVGWQAPAGLDLTVGAVATFEPQAGLNDDHRSQLLASPGAVFGTQFPISDTVRLNVEINAHVPYALDQGRWQAPILQAGVALKWLAF